MNKGIALAGNLLVDQIKYIQSYPPASALTTITDVTRSTGGLVCNCALTLAKLDGKLPVKAIGIVGDDDAGKYIIDQMAEHPSIDISGIMREGATSYTDVMTELEGGGRTFFQYRGANALLSPKHFDFTKIEADILHIGYILLLDSLDCEDSEYPTAMCRVLAKAKESGIATSIDVVSEAGQRFAKFVPPALAYADYCVINEMEAERTTGVALRSGDGGVIRENLEAACTKLLEMGVGRWVVIHMPEISCGMQRGGSYYEEESWNIPKGFKKSSVGAGDAFASGILYGAYNEWSLEKSINVAGAVAAYSLSGAGAADSIIPLDKLIGEMEKFKI